MLFLLLLLLLFLLIWNWWQFAFSGSPYSETWRAPPLDDEGFPGRQIHRIRSLWAKPTGGGHLHQIKIMIVSVIIAGSCQNRQMWDCKAGEVNISGFFSKIISYCHSNYSVLFCKTFKLLCFHILLLGSRFHDAYTHTRGEFFLVRRLAGRFQNRSCHLYQSNDYTWW